MYVIFTSSRALVVKQDTVARKHAVGLSVVGDDPVGIQLGCTWGVDGWQAD